MSNQIVFLNTNHEQINPEIYNPAGIILYGAGVNTARFMIECTREHKEINIICIVDADENKQGKSLFGVSVVAPASLTRYASNTCILIIPYMRGSAITKMLNSLGFYNLLYYNKDSENNAKHMKSLEKYASENRDELDNILDENAGKITYVREILCHDSKSLAVFDAKLDELYYAKPFALEALREENQYFAKDIVNLTDGEVFVDCGALDGSRVVEFTRRCPNYEYIYAFEPDPLQYVLTKMMFEKEKVERCELYNCAVYNQQGEMSFHSLGAGGHLGEGGDVRVQVSTLDSTLYDKENRPTMIKMDIEGAENEALEGAKKIIERDKPKLTICCYHGNYQIFEIPYWISTNFPNYVVYMRQHHDFNETVCYAIDREEKVT